MRHGGIGFRLVRAFLATDRRGNVAVIFALCLLPMLVAIGAAVDTARLHNAYSAAQADLDSALIATMAETGLADEARMSADLNRWFDAQRTGAEGTYSVGDVHIDRERNVVTAAIRGFLPTTLMGLVGIDRMPVNVVGSAKGADKPYTEIGFVIDKSASMLLAATPDGQKKMLNDVGCAFACHIPDVDIERKGYRSHYEYSRTHDIRLRADVAAEAFARSLSVIESADPSRERIKVGLYGIGADAREVLEPTLNMETVRRGLGDDRYGFGSGTSDDISDFRTSLSQLTRLIGVSGDGTLQAAPRKLAILVTDGVQSQRDWVHSDKDRHLVAPLNPQWCSDLKRNGVTLAVLYTEYLPLAGDGGYDRTLGETMASARWKEAWSGDRRPGIPGSISRRDYLPYALKDCAASEDLFLLAASQKEIERSIRSLLQTFVSAPRLTR